MIKAALTCCVAEFALAALGIPFPGLHMGHDHGISEGIAGACTPEQGHFDADGTLHCGVH